MKLRVAALALNQIPLDFQGNRARILCGLHEARAQGAQLVCTPELSLSGYGCEDAFLFSETSERALASLQHLSAQTKGLVLTLGLPFRLSATSPTYNGVAVLVDGQLLGVAAKRHLAREGVHYEPRFFQPWPQGTQDTLTTPQGEIPVGDLIFEVDGLRFGFEICEDAWQNDRPGSELSDCGAQLILNPSASHFAFDKQGIRRRIIEAGVRDFSVSYLYVNLLGNEAGRMVYDGDAVIAVPGVAQAQEPRVVVETNRFFGSDDEVVREHLCFSDHELVFADVSFSPCDSESTEAGSQSGLRPCIKSDFAFEKTLSPQLVSDKYRSGQQEEARAFSWQRAGEEQSEKDRRRFRQFSLVISLALMDYLRKTRSSGFVLSLSGGADSTTVALLVRLGVRFSIAQLGLKAFLERYDFIFSSQAAPPTTEMQVMGQLLTTVYQATENSGEITRCAAQDIASLVGSEHYQWEVQEGVDFYRQRVENSIGRPLNWQQDDLALQNIQARVRSPGIWLLANHLNALLLSTSNRSEAAVGYATMDGDTSGGLSPLAGIDKSFIRRFLVYLEKVGPAEMGALPALAAVNQQAPTAELRPQAAAQVDEHDLMPYDILDAIERRLLVQRASVALTYEALLQEFPEQSRASLLKYLERFTQLFCRNQWKRERYAPAFHVDHHNLDPRSWLRFPILSRGFAEQIAELKEAESQ